MASRKSVGGPDRRRDEVAQEIIGALTDFRDTLRARTPLEKKYTVRKVAVFVPPPQLGPEEIRKTRELLGVSQPVFAGFLGASPSTVRSWEQGQKPPSPMARRLLGFIASDPTYWKDRLQSMVEGASQESASGRRSVLVLRATSNLETDTPPRRNQALHPKAVKRNAGSKATR
jgi:putative transcriptional regulator